MNILSRALERLTKNVGWDAPKKPCTGPHPPLITCFSCFFIYFSSITRCCQPITCFFLPITCFFSEGGPEDYKKAPKWIFNYVFFWYNYVFFLIYYVFLSQWEAARSHFCVWQPNTRQTCIFVCFAYKLAPKWLMTLLAPSHWERNTQLFEKTRNYRKKHVMQYAFRGLFIVCSGPVEKKHEKHAIGRKNT